MTAKPDRARGGSSPSRRHVLDLELSVRPREEFDGGRHQAAGQEPQFRGRAPPRGCLGWPHAQTGDGDVCVAPRLPSVEPLSGTGTRRPHRLERRHAAQDGRRAVGLTLPRRRPRTRSEDYGRPPRPWRSEAREGEDRAAIATSKQPRLHFRPRHLRWGHRRCPQLRHECPRGSHRRLGLDTSPADFGRVAMWPGPEQLTRSMIRRRRRRRQPVAAAGRTTPHIQGGPRRRAAGARANCPRNHFAGGA